MTALAFNAIVFDLDGTLIDSLPDVRAALNRVLVEDGRREVSLAEAQGMVGEGATALLELALAATGEAVSGDTFDRLLARYLEFYRQSPADLTVVYPGVFEVLEMLRAEGLRMGICTNKPEMMSNLALGALGMSHLFSAVVGGDTLDFRKPDGRHVTAVLDRIGAHPASSVMVGDSQTDMRAARDAGLPVVAVAYGYSGVPPHELDADILIDGFGGLPDALRRLGAALAGIAHGGK